MRRLLILLVMWLLMVLLLLVLLLLMLLLVVLLLRRFLLLRHMMLLLWRRRLLLLRRWRWLCWCDSALNLLHALLLSHHRLLLTQRVDAPCQNFERLLPSERGAQLDLVHTLARRYLREKAGDGLRTGAHALLETRELKQVLLSRRVIGVRSLARQLRQ